MFWCFLVRQKGGPKSRTNQALGGLMGPKTWFWTLFRIQRGHLYWQILADSTFSCLTKPDTSRRRRILGRAGSEWGSPSRVFKHRVGSEWVWEVRSHQNPMPKQVAKQIMNIIKNHVFLMCKNMQIHCKGHCFWRLCSLGVRTEKVSDKNQTNIKNETWIHTQSNDKSMQNLYSKNWCQKDGKRCQRGAKRGTQIAIVSAKVMPPNATKHLRRQKGVQRKLCTRRFARDRLFERSGGKGHWH